MNKPKPIEKYLIAAMKFTLTQAVLMALFAAWASATHVSGQEILERPITIVADQKEIKSILDEIEQIADVRFTYSSVLVDAHREISIHLVDVKLSHVLDELFDFTVAYTVSRKQIILKPKAEAAVTDDVASQNSMTAADIMVTGNITSTDGDVLPGVNIIVKGSTVGTVSDSDGNYSLSVPNRESVLIFSFIGHHTQEVTVNDQTTINIALVPDTKLLQEVVVVGFGEQKKTSVTAAISTVNAKELTQTPTANISNMLAGRLPGLTSIQNTGEPGSDGAALYVRGLGSYAGSVAPLIMVDGVARDSYNNIDPNEIETISILKDASATAVYGVRGANGVILITTKRGKTGAPQISFTVETARSEFANSPKFVNSYDFARLHNERGFLKYWTDHAEDNDIKTWDDFVIKRDANWTKEAAHYYSDEDLKYYQNAHKPTLADGSKNPYYDPYIHPDKDWQSALFKDYALQTHTNLNINGGTEQVKYFLSLGYLNQGGMFETDYLPFGDESQFRYKRYNLRGNFDFDVTDNFRISVDIGGQHELTSGMGSTDQIWERSIYWSNPLETPGYINGKFVMPEGKQMNQNNPMHFNSSWGYTHRKGTTLNSSIKLTYKLDRFIKGLAANGRVAYDDYFSSINHGRYSSGFGSGAVWYKISPNPNGDVLDPIYSQVGNDNPLVRYPEGYSAYGVGTNASKWRKIYGELSLNYSRSFGLHTVGGLLLYNIEKRYDPLYQYQLPHAYLGVVGRVTYAYNEKYLAEFNLGYNGSENFPEGQRFGLLPSYSLGWVLTNESFFPQNDIVSFLKVRGSLGKVGNDNIRVNDVDQRYLYQPDTWRYTGEYPFGTVNERNWYGGAGEGRVGNPNVTWETATKANLGFEARFLRDQFSVTFDVFDEKRKDILSYKQTVPATVQADLPPYNLGEVHNWGYELEVGWRNTPSNFNYWIKGNVATNQNKILFQDEAIVPGLEYQAQTGKPIGTPLQLESRGLYTSWSQLYEIDANGNPILSKPVPARDENGDTYTSADGLELVYEKDLGYNGLNLQPGEIRIRDYNKDGVVNDLDRTRHGNSWLPKVSFGVSFGFDFKGFDFSTLLQGVSGVSREFWTRPFGANAGTPTAITEFVLNRFTIDRYNNSELIQYPMAATVSTPSDYFYADASYLRLKNLQIGYTFSHFAFMKKIGIESARVYVNGNNLRTWSKNPHYGDPENYDRQNYPIVRTYNVGLNINF